MAESKDYNTSVKRELADIARSFSPQLGVDCDVSASRIVTYRARELVSGVVL